MRNPRDNPHRNGKMTLPMDRIPTFRITIGNRSLPHIASKRGLVGALQIFSQA